MKKNNFGYGTKDFIIIVLLLIVSGLIYLNVKDKNISTIEEPVQPMQQRGSHKTTSSFEENQVHNTVKKNASKIQNCYNEYLAANPTKAEGKVLVDWQIKTNGNVENPEIVSNEFNDFNLGACIVKIIGSIQFPEPPTRQKTYISHTFAFKKVDEVAKKNK